MKPRVVIALNAAWNLVNFRAGLIRALVADGYEVIAVAPSDAYASRLVELGCRYESLPIDNQGTHPGRDLMLLWRFYRLLRRERPAVFLAYTVKPNIYGSLAARALGIPVVNNIAGLGAVFIRQGLLTRIVRGLYGAALRSSQRVFFQNDDDRRLFIEHGMVSPTIADRVPGSGVDLDRFHEAPLPALQGGVVRFLLVARMLWDKGVGEYVAAAQIVRRRYPQATFSLLGFLDVQNPSAISRAQMDAWHATGAVEYLGVSDDVRDQIAAADCVVLPSYREGVPRTLLEAAAMARPVVATDAVGCRDAVEEGVTGLLCQVRDVQDLAAKLERMIELTPGQRVEMGRQGRRKMEREFDEQIVVDKYLAAIREIVDGTST